MMSNSPVKFVNIKDYEVDSDRHCKICIEFVVDKDVKVSHNDWIAIYPQGSDIWTSPNLDLMVAYEFVMSCPVRKEDRPRRYTMEFSLKGAKKLIYGQKYQFVYMSRSSDIYGISESFEFRPPVLNEIPDKSDLSQESDDASKENLKDNPVRFNDKKRKINRRSRQPLVKVESEKSESEDLNKKDAIKFINQFNKNKQVFVKKETGMCTNNNPCVIHRIPPPVSCSNCHRVAGLLRAQEELYNKLKHSAEMNNDLRNQVALLQRRVELSQAACQKLSVTLMRERQAKLFYQAAAYERAEYEYQIMVVEPFVPSMFVPTSRNLPVLGRHRTEEKPKVGCSILKLKAIIGNQEEKIRSLTKEIAEMKTERAQRVTAIVRDIEEMNNSGDLHLNHEEREIAEGAAVVETAGSCDVN